MLGEVESRIAPVLRDIVGGASLTWEYKGELMQFLALQMLRGPVFVARHHENVDEFIPKELTTAHIKPKLVAMTGGDMELARERVVDLFRDATQRLMAMFTASMKVSAVLGSMRWQLLHFEDPPRLLRPAGRRLASLGEGLPDPSERAEFRSSGWCLDAASAGGDGGGIARAGAAGAEPLPSTHAEPARTIRARDEAKSPRSRARKPPPETGPAATNAKPCASRLLSSPTA